MNDNARTVLMDLRRSLLEQADKFQGISKVLVPAARDTLQQFEAAKTLGIVEGYLGSVRELDKLLES
jgi:hypothetical protein